MNIEAQTVVLPIGGMQITLGTIIFLVILVLLIFVLIKTVLWTYYIYQRNQFCAQYRVKLSKNVKIRRHQSSGVNCYWLEYPAWMYPNKDGSCDLRRNGNRLFEGTSLLYVDQYAVFCDNPFLMVWLVNVLREKGVEIEKCQEEINKSHAVEVELARERDFQHISQIVNQFREVPTDFEEYCARLFRNQGYSASVTSRSRDGGYDIELRDESGTTSIVECKCYEPSHRIGRETVQKLVGANAVCNADKMIFITTSDYSADAKEYAREVGVQLIDGSDLLVMVKKHYALKGDRPQNSFSEWRLNWDDVARGCPPDSSYRRFDL